VKAYIAKPSYVVKNISRKCNKVGIGVFAKGLEIGDKVSIVSLYFPFCEKVFLIPIDTVNYKLSKSEIKILKKLFEGLEVIGHCLSYDLALLKSNFNMEFKNILDDTYLLSKIVGENCKFKVLANKFLNVSVSELVDVMDIDYKLLNLKESSINWDIANKKVRKYCVERAVFPVILREEIKNRTLDWYDLFYDTYCFELKFLKYIISSSAEGLCVNRSMKKLFGKDRFYFEINQVYSQFGVSDLSVKNLFLDNVSLSGLLPQKDKKFIYLCWDDAFITCLLNEANSSLMGVKKGIFKRFAKAGFQKFIVDQSSVDLAKKIFYILLGKDNFNSVSESEVNKFKKRLYQKFKCFRDFNQFLLDELDKKGFVITSSGRIIFGGSRRWGKDLRMLNDYIISLVNDYFKTLIFRVCNSYDGFKFKLAFNNYVVFEVDKRLKEGEYVRILSSNSKFKGIEFECDVKERYNLDFGIDV